MTARRGASLWALLSGVSLAPVARGLRRSTGALGLQSFSDVDACDEQQPLRQTMTNDHDVQYHLPIKLGGQTIQGVVDTGSFELVVFSRSCSTCGSAPAYDESASKTFKKGRQEVTHSYGSGSCVTVDAWDEVDVGCYSAPRQAMWMAVDCAMPVLEFASFNAIVGVGPPGLLEKTARTMMEEVKEQEDWYKQLKKKVPPAINSRKRYAEGMLKDAREKKPMLESMGIKSFSACLGRELGSDAVFVWNDIDRRDKPGVMTFPVVGDVTWSVVISNVGLHGPKFSENVGCQRGCGAIVDTGTSLLGVPTEMYRKVSHHLVANHRTDCSDLSRLPDLVITIDGHELKLPPSSYMGRVEGSVNDDAAQYVHTGSLAGEDPESGTSCQLLLMDVGDQDTGYGPLFILGMPFFREFYTTFSLGEAKGGHSITVVPADHQCFPNMHPETQTFESSRSHYAVTPRVVNGSKLRVPHWLSQRKGRGL